MEKLRIIDADSHIEEVSEVWDHLDADYQARRPFPITVEKNIGYTNLNAFWYIDGAVVPKLVGQGAMVIATPLTSHMHNRNHSPLAARSRMSKHD
jgi:hypothetical protein